MDSHQVEDHRAGYPRYSALIAACDAFHLCRRFSNLRVRLLLAKQDRLSMLEKELERIDREERSPLFLGSSRSDRNQERSTVLAKIDAALAEYDALIERNGRILGLDAAKPRDVNSLRNWVNGNACLTREETAYLGHDGDLVNVVPSDDGAMAGVEAWVEDKIVDFRRDVGQVRGVPYTTFGRHMLKVVQRWRTGISRDPNVYFFPPCLVARAARTLMMCLIISLLVGPSMICIALESMKPRIAVVAISIAIFIVVLSTLMKAKSVEIFIAGASYATVLIVFVSSTKYT